MLQQEVVLQGEAAVLVVQLSQEVVEANGGQRVLHGHCFPAGGTAGGAASVQSFTKLLSITEPVKIKGTA